MNIDDKPTTLFQSMPDRLMKYVFCRHAALLLSWDFGDVYATISRSERNSLRRFLTRFMALSPS